MATLIPALGACVSRMTSGEKRLAQRLNNLHKESHAWGDMAIFCPDYSTRDLCAQVLHQRQMPLEMRRSPGDFDPTSNTIKVMTMMVSKGLEFPVVALPGVGHMPAKGEDEQEAARVFYVAATRATQRLVIWVGGDGGFGRGSACATIDESTHDCPMS